MGSIREGRPQEHPRLSPPISDKEALLFLPTRVVSEEAKQGSEFSPPPSNNKVSEEEQNENYNSVQ